MGIPVSHFPVGIPWEWEWTWHSSEMRMGMATHEWVGGNWNQKPIKSSCRSVCCAAVVCPTC